MLKQPPQIRFIVTPDLKTRIENEAKRIGISVTDFMKLLLSQYFNGIEFGKKENKDAK